jgi:hypothetical protein
MTENGCAQKYPAWVGYLIVHDAAHRLDSHLLIAHRDGRLLSEDPMSMLSAVEFSTAPWIAVGLIGITALRLNGWLSDELMAELRKPFSRATLMAVGTLAVVVAQICWIGSKL